MHVEQIYTGCLAQGAYYIRSGNEAAIIDPLREVQPYIDRAKADGVEIKYIFETHFHADFVSGHVTLSKRTGAPIVFGPLADPRFKAHIAKDQEEFKVGDLTLVALHTPGHTMESTTYLLKDAAGRDHAIFSGDTLFLGDVGRPDLAQKGEELTQEDLAKHLFKSLREKIMTLADDVIVYPAHGAGSACGKHMSSETVGTIGDQKLNNYALRGDMTAEEFVAEVTDGLAAPPAYFPLNVKMNKEGYEDLGEVLERAAKGLDPAVFEEIANTSGALVLDVRNKTSFAKAHIPRSIFIGLDGSFAPWVGALIKDTAQEILLVAPKGREEEAITRLSRVGFDGAIGFLQGGIEAWLAAGKETDTVAQVLPSQFGDRSDDYRIVDVRKPGEYSVSHLPESTHVPLVKLNESFNRIPREGQFYLHCRSGYRSLIAASILKSRGIHNFIEIADGHNGMLKEGIPMNSSVPETVE